MLIEIASRDIDPSEPAFAAIELAVMPAIANTLVAFRIQPIGVSG